MMRTSGRVMRTSRPSMVDMAVAALPVPMLPISRRVSISMLVSSSKLRMFISYPLFYPLSPLMVDSISSEVVIIFSAIP